MNGGVPLINIVFPNGHQDTMILKRFNPNPNDEMLTNDCNYLGHLKTEVTACVAVTGCYGVEDVEMTILSRNSEPTALFKLSADGTVEAISSLPTNRAADETADETAEGADDETADETDDQTADDIISLPTNGTADETADGTFSLPTNGIADTFMLPTSDTTESHSGVESRYCISSTLGYRINVPD